MKKVFTSHEKAIINAILDGAYHPESAIEILRDYLGIDDLEEEITLLKDELQQLKVGKDTCVDEEMGELRRALTIKVTEIINSPNTDIEELDFAVGILTLLFKYPQQAKKLL